MSRTAPHVIGQPLRLLTDARTGPPAPLLWQRTDTVGTELVFTSGPEQRTATGSAIVARPLPHSTVFHAELVHSSGEPRVGETCLCDQCG